MNVRSYLVCIAIVLLVAGGLYYVTTPPSCVSRQMKRWKTDEVVALRMCEDARDGE